MMFNRKIEDILNECVDLLADGVSVEECVGRFPEHRAEIEPMVQTAAVAMRTAIRDDFAPDAKARALARLMEAVSRSEPGRSRRPGIFERVPLLKPLAIGFAAFALMGAGAAGTAMASSDSIPGDTLYWVKTTKERIALRLPKSEMGRVRSHARLAGVRSGEMQRLVFLGRDSEAEQMIGQIEYHLKESADLMGLVVPANQIEVPLARVDGAGSDEMALLMDRLERDAEILHVRVREMMDGATASQRRLLEKIRGRPELRYRALIAALEGESFPMWRSHSLVVYTRLQR